MIKSIVTALAGVFTLTIAQGACAFSWSVVELGSLGSGATKATALNNRGEVVGYSKNAAGYDEAFLYSKGSLHGLGTLGGRSSFAWDINNSGQVVGGSLTANASSEAFLYRRGELQGLGVRGAARGINDAGTIVGGTGGYATSAFIYRDGDVDYIAPGSAYAINNAGQVVGGFKNDIRASYDSFLYADGELSRFTIWQRAVEHADDINEAGQILINGEGHYRGDPNSHAIAYLVQDGVPTALPGLNRYGTTANGINNAGDIVGSSEVQFKVIDMGDYMTFESVAHGTLYRNGTLHDLNQLDIDYASIFESGTYFKEAIDINDKGQIIAHDNIGRAYLLTPVPEPETYALLFGGLGLTGAVARRRRGGKPA